MTKSSSMDLPDSKKFYMYYCEICKHHVPDRKKHNRKKHKELKLK